MKVKNNIDIAMKLKELEQEAINEIQKPLKKIKRDYRLGDVFFIEDIKKVPKYTSMAQRIYPKECLTDFAMYKEFDLYEIIEKGIDLEKQVTCINNIGPFLLL